MTGLVNQQNNIIVCNNAYKLFPKALLAHHADANWWQTFGDALQMSYQGKLITGSAMGIAPFIYPANVQKLQLDLYKMFDKSASYTFGIDTGMQALTLAHLFIPENIILLGFDLTHNLHGESHWHTDYNTNNAFVPVQPKLEKNWQHVLTWYKKWYQLRENNWQQMGYTEPLPKIFNASPMSAINEFPKIGDLSGFV